MHHVCSYPIGKNSSDDHTRDAGKFGFYSEKPCVQLKIKGYVTVGGKDNGYWEQLVALATVHPFATQTSMCSHLPNHPYTKGDNSKVPCSY